MILSYQDTQFPSDDGMKQANVDLNLNAWRTRKQIFLDEIELAMP